MLAHLPNALTLARLAAVPGVVALAYWPTPLGAALLFALFLAAGLTDFVDGWLARRLGQVTRLGALLDPIADKLLVAAVLVLLAAEGTVSGVHVVAVVAILCRELFISGLREFLAGEARALPVSAAAKWKTALQMLALGVLVAARIEGLAWPGLEALGLALLWAAALLSLWTAGAYAAAAIRPPAASPKRSPP